MTAFTGGISNSGSIVAAAYGIVVTQVSAFAGGVTNNGKISAGGVSGAIFVNNVGNFSGGIVNAAGALISAQTSGIGAVGVSTFAGGISNKGTIFAAKSGIFAGNDAVFLGGISNSGKIRRRPATETADTRSKAGRRIRRPAQMPSAGGGVTNTGTISAPGATGIGIVGVSLFQGFASGGNVNQASVMVGTIAGGVRNAGTISAGDGISNGGTISAGSTGILTVNVVTFASGIKPTAETWARTTVESNICTKCAVSLIAARASKNASKVPDPAARTASTRCSSARISPEEPAM